MTQTQAIIASAALVAAALIFTNGIRPATAFEKGPFMLMQHSNTAANAGVFRIDTMSGEVSYCYVAGSGGVGVVCTGSAR